MSLIPYFGKISLNFMWVFITLRTIESCPTNYKHSAKERSTHVKIKADLLYIKHREYPLIFYHSEMNMNTNIFLKYTWKKEKLKSLSVWLVGTLWTRAYQLPPSVEFSRREDRSGLPFKYCLYVKPKKLVQMNLFTKQKQNYRCRKQSYGYQRGKGRRDKLGG